MAIEENGPWSVEIWSEDRVVILSADFTHDVALTVSGDFTCFEQKREYAEEIAARLNAWKPDESSSNQARSEACAKAAD